MPPPEKDFDPNVTLIGKEVSVCGVWQCLTCGQKGEMTFSDVSESGTPICTDDAGCEGDDMDFLEVKVIGLDPKPPLERKISSMRPYFDAIQMLEKKRNEVMKTITEELFEADFMGDAASDMIRGVMRGYDLQIKSMKDSLVGMFGLIDA